MLLQEFQQKAVETLNAMAWKNLYKTFKQYPGEFRVITSAPSLYESIMRAFHWYESGDLINPDTGVKYKDETSDEKWGRKYTVAYTFKCLKGLGPKSLAVLVERITNGLDFDGNYTSPEKKDETPKVYLGQPRPKNKFTSSLKEWTDRRKAKNAVIRFFNKRWAGQIWEDEDVNIDEWRKFKFDVGFNACHMDELIRRGTKKYLQKFMKVSDTPKREQEAPPEAFSAELLRVLKKEKTYARRPLLFPPMSVYRTSGKLSTFAAAKDWEVPFDSDPEEDRRHWATVDTTEMTFQGGILDFRGLDEFMEQEDAPFDPALGKCYLAIMKPFLEPKNFLTAAPYWLVICHTNKRSEALRTMRKLLPEWSHVESRYVPANAETYLLSPAATKKGNGVTLFVMHRPKASPLVWQEQVRSAERYRKVGSVREYGIYDFELRMEVYMDFISQLPRLKEGMENVMCITAGRKCMIAAFVSFEHSTLVIEFSASGQLPTGVDRL